MKIINVIIPIIAVLIGLGLGAILFKRQKQIVEPIKDNYTVNTTPFYTPRPQLPLDEYDEETRAVLQKEPFADGWLVDEEVPGWVAVPFNKDQVTVTHYDGDGCIPPEIFTPRHLIDNCIIIENNYYRDHWHRRFVTYLPKLTNEITDETIASNINKIFSEKHNEEREKYQNGEYVNFDRLDSSVNSIFEYWCKDYQAELVDKYLTIGYFQFNYISGVRMSYSMEATYNFDTTTGELLRFENLFSNEEECSLAVDKALKTNAVSLEYEVDAPTVIKQLQHDYQCTDLEHFRLTSQGVKLEFNRYDLPVLGLVNAIIPYDETNIVI